MTIIEKELKEIGENYQSFVELNELILKWGQKNNWYIVLNRIPKKGWLVYGLENGGKQNYHSIGLKLLEEYFDKPITMLNNFINLK